MDVVFSAVDALNVEVDLLAVGITGDGAADLSRTLGAFGHDIAGYLKDRKFEAKGGASLLVPTFGRAKAKQLVIVGLGDRGTNDRTLAGAKVGAISRGEKAITAAVAFGALDGATARDVLELVSVGNYAYDPYLPEAQKRPSLNTLTVLDNGDGAAIAGAAKAAGVRAAWQQKARDLVNAPPADIYPESLAAEARKLESIPHVTVEVWDIKRCEAEGLVGIVAVGQGSARPGVMIRVSYRPPNAKDHVALVGKGVTFDSGGLSLKPTDGMLTMRCDMGGAATALAATGAIAELGLAVAVDTFLPCVENMPSGTSYKLGDILRYKNGVTVEIQNTDAEGRLILADALILASEVPGVSRVVDLATLTGAILVALGPDYTGLFTKDQGLADELTGAYAAANEAVWRLPLVDAYNRLIKGTWGQIKNTGGRNGGSITAGLFLGYFVKKDTRWAHLDIAGSAFYDGQVDPYVKGATGQSVRTLVNWVEKLGA